MEDLGFFGWLMITSETIRSISIVSVFIILGWIAVVVFCFNKISSGYGWVSTAWRDLEGYKKLVVTAVAVILPVLMVWGSWADAQEKVALKLQNKIRSCEYQSKSCNREREKLEYLGVEISEPEDIDNTNWENF